MTMLNLKRIEELGAMDYYLDLKKYIQWFIDKNYPLTEDDMKALLRDENTFNISKRQEIGDVMNKALVNIMENVMNKNEQFINDLNAGKNVTAINRDQYNKEIFDYKQLILEELYRYRNNSEKIQSQEIFNNGYNITKAVEEGISAKAVNSILEDMLKKTEEVGSTPKQVKESIETIADMKKDTDSKVDENYSSELVRNNSDKINKALSDGIEPHEVATTLINSTNNANNKSSKRKLNFIVKLISKMKKKELVLDRQNQFGKSYQKIKE